MHTNEFNKMPCFLYTAVNLIHIRIGVKNLAMIVVISLFRFVADYGDSQQRRLFPQ